VLLSYDRGRVFTLAGMFAILIVSITVANVVLFFGLSPRSGTGGSASPDLATSVPPAPTRAAAAVSRASSPDVTSQIREYSAGEVISLPSRPGASVIVMGVEWRDRIARQMEAGEIGYVDADRGRFLVVTYEFTNATDAPVDFADAVEPTLVSEGGDVYRPTPMSGTLDGNGEPLIVPEAEAIAAGATGTRVRFFDVRNGFGGGYLHSAADEYRLAVGPAQ